MHRHIVTEISATALNDNLSIITPTKAIANYLQAPYYSLESLAQNTVCRQRWSIASALLSRRLFQDAVREIVATKDIIGAARVFLLQFANYFTTISI